MAVNYLKKTKMHELACKLRDDVPGIRECEYKFYRGSEWLKWYADEECEDGYIQWELYVCKAYCSLSKVQHLESVFKAITLGRQVFINNKVS